jgi:hypothetical protein
MKLRLDVNFPRDYLILNRATHSERENSIVSAR